ncbi:hypothetical protein [Halorubrum lacusprofundi]|jgi:hypothetical protein|uniref:hypothetical protein n=1 Tax=Halorubrum lacusprofundi TaxID=2247 RepID=UPI000B5A9C19|nr:hypothetical protein [Halorubrum lacusprofundi]MCG1008249.1 hypothetical protein [Halorubrum lacusprofundi]
MSGVDQEDESDGGVEHPTPECDCCGGERTRPLDKEVAVCFDCDNEWRYEEDYSEHFEVA